MEPESEQSQEMIFVPNPESIATDHEEGFGSFYVDPEEETLTLMLPSGGNLYSLATQLQRLDYEQVEPYHFGLAVVTEETTVMPTLSATEQRRHSLTNYSQLLDEINESNDKTSLNGESAFFKEAPLEEEVEMSFQPNTGQAVASRLADGSPGRSFANDSNGAEARFSPAKVEVKSRIFLTDITGSDRANANHSERVSKPSQSRLVATTQGAIF